MVFVREDDVIPLNQHGARGIRAAVWGLLLLTACNRDRDDQMTGEAKHTTMAATTTPREKRGDACGFTAEVALGPPDDDGMRLVPPSHPDIRYLGRIDCTDPARLRMSHAGVSIEVHFQGAAIEMLLDDFGVPDYPNYFNVILDGGPPTLLAVRPDETRYRLADALDSGAHTLTLFKRTESCADGNENSGKVIFRGFRVPDGARILPRSAPVRLLIEFIGDSITCGYGNEVSTLTPEHSPYTTRHSNAYLAYGAVASRMLDADYLEVAYSGRGMVRNYAGFLGKTLPEMYLDILPDDPLPGQWDVNRFSPDIIVINLGSNDFSEGLDAAEVADLEMQFRDEYDLFLDTLRRYYPDAAFILGIGPLISDSYPPGYAALSRVKDVITTLVRQRRARGDTRVYMLIHAPQTAPYGEDWHPTAARHDIMAEELTRFIRAHDLL